MDSVNQMLVKCNTPEVVNSVSLPLIRPMIVCKDGFELSVQANRIAYCTPRDDVGPYSHVEVKFYSDGPEPHEEWLYYAEEPEKDPTKTVYGRVPVEMVLALVELHGGIQGFLE